MNYKEFVNKCREQLGKNVPDSIVPPAMESKSIVSGNIPVETAQNRRGFFKLAAVGIGSVAAVLVASIVLITVLLPQGDMKRITKSISAPYTSGDIVDESDVVVIPPESSLPEIPSSENLSSESSSTVSNAEKKSEMSVLTYFSDGGYLPVVVFNPENSKVEPLSDIVKPVLVAGKVMSSDDTILADGQNIYGDQAFFLVFNEKDQTYIPVLFNLKTKTYITAPKLQSSDLREYTFNNKTKSLAYNSTDELILYDFTTGKKKVILKRDKDWIWIFNPTRYSDTGKYVLYIVLNEGSEAAGGKSDTHIVYNRETDKKINITGRVYGFVKNDQYIIVETADGYFKIDPDTGKRSKVTDADGFAAHEYYVIPERSLYPYYSESTAMLNRVDIRTGKSVKITDAKVYPILISPDKRSVYYYQYQSDNITRVDISTLAKTGIKLSDDFIKKAKGCSETEYYFEVDYYFLSENRLILRWQFNKKPVYTYTENGYISVGDLVEGCDSIAGIAEKYPKMVNIMSFYEGSGYAYIKMISASKLSIIVEDYRIKKMYGISCNTGSDFDILHFHTESNSNVYFKPLGAKGTLQGFKAIAQNNIKAATMDYYSFIKDGKVDNEKMAKYVFNRDEILKRFESYYIMDRNYNDIQTRYSVADKNHLQKFFDKFLSKSVELIKWPQSTDEYFEMTINIRDEYGDNRNNMRLYSIIKSGDKYCIVQNGGYGVYLTAKEYSELKEWMKPVLEATSDNAMIS